MTTYYIYKQPIKNNIVYKYLLTDKIAQTSVLYDSFDKFNLNLTNLIMNYASDKKLGRLTKVNNDVIEVMLYQKKIYK